MCEKYFPRVGTFFDTCSNLGQLIIYNFKFLYSHPPQNFIKNICPSFIVRPIVWHVSISDSRVESESNEPLHTAARRPEFIVNLVPGVRTCRLAAQASGSDLEPLRTARAYDLAKDLKISMRTF